MEKLLKLFVIALVILMGIAIAHRSAAEEPKASKTIENTEDGTLLVPGQYNAPTWQISSDSMSLQSNQVFSVHIDEDLKKKIEILANCESSNRSFIKVLDTNNHYSYGSLQFQMQTWLSYGKLYDLKTTEENIYDGDLQKELAYRMINDKKSNWNHWLNCATKHGLK